jgi:hypothetical protein
MATSARTVPPANAPSAARSATEAARYALLRRLAPSIRHHLVVNLQPIGMVYEVMDRRLRAPQPDLHEVRDSAHKINGFARAALDSSLDVVTWLAPPNDAVIAPMEGVRECFGLLATSLTFRGYALRNAMPAVPGAIPRSAIRNVLTATLIHMTDESPPPAEVELSGDLRDNSVVLALTLKAGEGESGFAPELPYRALTWDDVQAIAAAEGVALSRDGRQKISLAIPSVSSH